VIVDAGVEVLDGWALDGTVVASLVFGDVVVGSED
jgi:hypothetical protein